jgi:hypothetical protein
MFLIAITEKNGAVRYWSGGDMWSETAQKLLDSSRKSAPA